MRILKMVPPDFKALFGKVKSATPSQRYTLLCYCIAAAAFAYGDILFKNGKPFATADQTMYLLLLIVYVIAKWVRKFLSLSPPK